MVLSITEHEELSRIYDKQVVPIWSRNFGEVLLDKISISPGSMILDVGCGTGYPALELLKQVDQKTRIIALDSSLDMLAVARRKAIRLSGKRIFFRHEKAEKLSFTDGVFDLVISNVALPFLSNPEEALREMIRVLKPGGKLAITLIIRGIFQEFYDLYQEVFERHDWPDALSNLNAHLLTYPDYDEAIAMLESARLKKVKLSSFNFKLPFGSGQEFINSPLVKTDFLQGWQSIVRDQSVNGVLDEVAKTIDTYFATIPFETTVRAAYVEGTKQELAAPPESIEESGIPKSLPKVPPGRSATPPPPPPPLPPKALLAKNLEESGTKPAPDQEAQGGGQAAATRNAGQDQQEEFSSEKKKKPSRKKK